MSSNNSDSKSLFKEESLFVLSTGITNIRRDIFKKKFQAFGGKVVQQYNESVTYVVVDDELEIDRLCHILKIEKLPQGIAFVKSKWLSECIKTKTKVDIIDYALKEKVIVENFPDEQNSSLEEKPEPYLKEDFGPDSDYVASENENEKSDVEEIEPTKKKWKPNPSHWACAHSSAAPGASKVNHNKNITDKLEPLAKAYENVKDRWRALGYQKAITALKSYSKPITTFEEALSLRGVGKRLAEKIWEIVESGDLRKLHEVAETEEVQIIDLFTNIWGAGATTARQWYLAGHRTLDDLLEKATLTRQQKVGLRLYDDLKERMTREEAGEIEKVVKEAALSLRSGLVCMACGSYRRLKPTCGDVDVLITHPDGQSHKGLFEPLLKSLHKAGFLTDDLVTQEDNGAQKKYLGVCKLPGEQTKHRRLDIIIVPYEEYACALMYFTGSAHFNRSMRHLAGKMGMSLSEHSLNKGVIRKGGEKLNPGIPLPTPTEESVFEHLGLKYRPPEERNH